MRIFDVYLRTPLAPLLRRLGPWPRERGVSRHAPLPGLGIEGLPQGVGRMPRGTATALLVHDEPQCHGWAAALLLDWLASRPVLLLAAQASDIDALLRIAPLAQAHVARRLRTWLLPAAAQQRLRREGLSALARELHQAGLSPGVGLCVLDAGAMVAGASVAQLRQLARQWRRFSAPRPGPLALLFALQRHAGGDSAAAARLVSGTFEQVAELGSTAEGLLLTLHRWDGDQGAVAHARYSLQLAAAQGEVAARLSYSGTHSQGASPMLVQAPDADQVLATSASVAGQRGVPSSWTIAGDLAALEGAASQAMGATVLLDAGAPEQFAAVAQLVHRLRRARPRSLKIIVRETHGKLRAHSEQALLRLGATTVVYCEVGFARLLRLIEDCRPLLHTRAVDADCQQTLDACMPAPLRGYLKPLAFVHGVRDMVERTRPTGLEHCLVHLQLLPAVTHLDALRACRPLRDGDLLSADAQGIYVFLFACIGADVESVLARVFSLPLEQCFGAQRTDASAGGMESMLEQLQAAGPGLPDYSLLLHGPAAMVPTAVPALPATPVEPPAHACLWAAGQHSLAAPDATPNASGSPVPAGLRARPIGRRAAGAAALEATP